MRTRWFAWGLVALAAAAFGCAATRPHSSAPASAFAAFDSLPAPETYRTLCAHCHGPDAAGYAADRAPSLVNPTFLESADDFYLHHSIEEGRPGTSMAAYARSAGGPLAPEAVDRLVGWIRSHGPGARDLPPVARGDSARGRPLYATHCQSCHGDLGTHGEDVMLANPEFLALASDAFIQHAILEGRPGTAMVSFRGTLDTLQVADIVRYLRSLEQPVDTRRLAPPTGKEPLFAYPHGEAPNFTIKDGRFVGVDQVDAALEQQRRLVIIDARPESDWRTTHITGAISIPYYRVQRLDEIPKDAWVVAYCACPHHLSGVVVDSLRAHGRPNAFVLDEGILEWERRGYPIVAAPGASLPPTELKPPGGSRH
jgi:cytochrome c oxidase cbb3-type subunit 3/ubiquinol-cytochrome c reductase cytochrome c subunit